MLSSKLGSSALRSAVSAPITGAPIAAALVGQRKGYATKAASTQRKAVLVDGCRTPFSLSGTHFNDLMAHDLGRMAIHGLMQRTALDAKDVDRVIYGTVIQECRTSNIARECALGAGFPLTTPCHTVTQACISANQAMCSGVDAIQAGRADIVIAGGVETMSDVPIRFSPKMRKAMLASQKVKSPAGYAKLLGKLSLGDLAPELPAIAEFSTGETMGVSSDRMSARFGIKREDQDEFALRSHHNAAKATADGILKKEIVPVAVKPKFNVIDTDNGIRGEAKLEKLASLKPAFIKPHGTHTAANSSFLTDGASACLIMGEDKAKAMGYEAKSHFKDYVFCAQDPKEELLLGPAYGISMILERNNLTLKDIDVWEIHEAFAGQVLSNLAAINSDKWAQEKGLKKVGDVPFDKLNLWGGSLAVGHPFGATGTRIAVTATNRLHAEGGRFAIISACAAGGLGHTCLIERL
eukprot:GFYU01000983.1.p2 GENE.GFYU01000983.1~~GFYU01000983.1.p2  ORF type:complete len:497 (-),score=138.07 GFYU01000983.1:333-1730(-)